MTTTTKRFYYFHPESKIFYHSMEQQPYRDDWMFMGTSENPNTKMVVTSLAKQIPDGATGYKIKAV